MTVGYLSFRTKPACIVPSAARNRSNAAWLRAQLLRLAGDMDIYSERDVLLRRQLLAIANGEAV